MDRRSRGTENGTTGNAAGWRAPAIVTTIICTIIGGFYIGGPGLGMAVGALAVASIIVVAVRHPPLAPIVPAPLRDFRRHLLVVVSRPLDDAETVDEIARAAHVGDDDEAEILVLAPARHRFIDRWTSDDRPAREEAHRNLVLSLASLARADIGASARIGDEDPVRAVEDELQTFPATEVILVTGSRDFDAIGNAAAPELRSRLRAEFHHLLLD